MTLTLGLFQDGIQRQIRIINEIPSMLLHFGFRYDMVVVFVEVNTFYVIFLLHDILTIVV